MALTRLQRAEQLRQFVLENVDLHPNDIAVLARRKFGVTRQAVNRQIRSLVEAGLLVSEGHTLGTKYRRATDYRTANLLVPGLSEYQVWETIALPVLTGLPKNILDIGSYGFTEMLNNVVDHSESDAVHVSVKRTADKVELQIIDKGVGIFRKIQRECHLEDARHAVFELTKGKLTTDPEHHTGEGIFFTSRMFDEFTLMSGELFLKHHRDGDWLLHDTDDRDRQGTLVAMTIHPESVRTVKEVFDKYQAEQDDYAFNKTHVVVELAKSGEERLVSRSQAKRIVARLERFKEVVFDFANIEDIGPAFADEIFRVFASSHPAIHLEPARANEQVMGMIRRAQSHQENGPPVASASQPPERPSGGPTE